MRTDAIFDSKFNMTAEISKLTVVNDNATFVYSNTVKLFLVINGSTSMTAMTKEALNMSDRLGPIRDSSGELAFPADSDSRFLYVNSVQPQLDINNKVTGYKSVLRNTLPPTYTDLLNSLNASLGL
jgi:hypothetical protein